MLREQGRQFTTDARPHARLHVPRRFLEFLVPYFFLHPFLSEMSNISVYILFVFSVVREGAQVSLNM